MAFRIINLGLAVLLCTPAYGLENAGSLQAIQKPGSPAPVLTTAQSEAFAQNGNLDESEANSSAKKLEGSVTLSVPYSFKSHLDSLLESADRQNSDIARYQKAIDHYGTTAYKIAARAADTANYTLMFRGITPSCEAGDVVLDEKEKLKSLASAKWLKQKTEDELHLQVLSDVMQMAMLMGAGKDTQSEGDMQAAVDQLSKLVGEKEAQKTVAFLSDLKDHGAVQAVATNQPLWTASQTEQRVEDAIRSAAINDSVIKDIEHDVHHYNIHSNAMLFGQRLVRVALSAISLSPSIIGPAAQATLFSFLLVTGGPEQDKVLKELYLDKRLSSRAHLLNEEAHLALENYQLGALTKNKLLMTCSEQMLSQLTDQETAVKLLGDGEVADSQPAVR